MTTAILVTPGTLIFIGALCLAFLGTYLKWRYDWICKEDERRGNRPEPEDWPWPTAHVPTSRSVMEREQLPW